MKSLQQTRREILAIRDPHEAYIRLGTAVDLPLEEVEKIMDEYMEKYGVTHEEMAYTETGERVLTLEEFQKRTQ